MRKKIIAGNWKMNCDRVEALSLVTEISGMVADEVSGDAVIIVAPPFVHIAAVSSLLENSVVQVAAQNCSAEPSGAFTGEISARMLRSVGATWVIIGHSERRLLFGETHDLLRKKTDLVIAEGLKLIFCCGETLEQRESGQHFAAVRSQLTESLFHLAPAQLQEVVVAYEPVWAIGTGKTASPEQAQEMHAFIRGLFSEKYGAALAVTMSLLYGGSCNENNAGKLFTMPDVDGGLIGGASLKSRSFVNIIRSIPA